MQPFKLQTRNGGVKGQGPLRSLGGLRGIFSHVREYPVGQIKKVQLFLKNPLDKWAPRAIMQPTSEELQTYDGEK